jgi:hypothetical protein
MYFSPVIMAVDVNLDSSTGRWLQKRRPSQLMHARFHITPFYRDSITCSQNFFQELELLGDRSLDMLCRVFRHGECENITILQKYLPGDNERHRDVPLKLVCSNLH